ncbi:hypothetical protein FRC10_001753 [Ceratobasidium sp. 414]|nr:hypothetical protein FRC10_001753 [Ceratobasidium sp. 414]
MAMSSGLYQRRSFGFEDHFVFGTAHHSKRLLTIYAEKWADHANLPTAARSSQPAAKIIIYTLGTFHMNSTIKMFQYYLPMRDTRRLALEYKALIDNQATLLTLRAEPSTHSWPPAAQPKSSANAKKRKNIGSEAQGAPGEDAPETNMAFFGAGDYVQQPVHVVGAGDPLVHRFAEELSENGENAKVRGYLMTSVHDNYNYQIDTS